MARWALVEPRGVRGARNLGDSGCDDSALVFELLSLGAEVDTLLGAGYLDILKVDVEGHEWQVLLGARRGLSEGRRAHETDSSTN